MRQEVVEYPLDNHHHSTHVKSSSFHSNVNIRMTHSKLLNEYVIIWQLTYFNCVLKCVCMTCNITVYVCPFTEYWKNAFR